MRHGKSENTAASGKLSAFSEKEAKRSPLMLPGGTSIHERTTQGDGKGEMVRDRTVYFSGAGTRGKEYRERRRDDFFWK